MMLCSRLCPAAAGLVVLGTAVLLPFRGSADVRLDFESPGQFSGAFRAIFGTGTAAQTDPAAAEPDNDTVRVDGGAAVLLYDATPGEGAATRSVFTPPFSVTARVRFGAANQSFGLYFVHPTNDAQALLALLNVDHSGANEQFRFSSDGVPVTGGAGTLVQTLSANAAIAPSDTFHRVEIGCAVNARNEPVLSLWAGTGVGSLTLTGVTAQAAVQLALRVAVGAGARLDFDDLAIRPVPAPAAPAATNAGSRLVRRLAAGEPQKVVVYGTSLTAVGAWVGQMQDWLTNTYAGTLTLVNSGLSGKNSKDGLANLDARVLAHDPDTVFIEFGMNDAFSAYADSAYNLTVAQARSNLVELIDRILAHHPGTEIILQTMNPAWDSPAGSTTSATVRATLPECYQSYREVAAERGLLLLDHYVNWKTLQLTSPATYQAYVPDGVHPVAAGTAAVTMPLLKERLIGEVRVADTNRPGPVLLETDVCVYGGTSAGVAAAVQAARLGKRCILVSPQRRLGGLSSGGLGWTDIGNRDAIGGLAREFYRRIYLHYLDDAAWTAETRADYVARSSLDPDATRRMMFTFEPGVAARVFDDILAEARVPLVLGRLRRPGGVALDGARVRELYTDDGRTVVRAGMFIDATYEGDLLAEAGVPYAVGREANAEFNETLNGIQTARAVSHQLGDGVSPYVVAGDASSGLLPGVEPDAGAADGTGDGRLQAYNYRMCLTSIASNRVAITQPAGYNEAGFALLFRAIAAGQTAFFSTSPMPNRKTDSNNSGGFSTDFIGGNYSLTGGWNYAEAGYAQREQIAAAHRAHQLGLMWTLQNSANVPAAIRNAVAGLGLPADEFEDGGHWPAQLYVREARRMRSDFVITQRHVNQEAGFVADDPVGMGGYNMDSHHARRHVNAAGMVKNEGDIQVSPARGPYGISFRALVPPSNSVQNLLAPVCVSATHIAYGSVRMEPVFMILAQSAATAAAQALDAGTSVQAADYAALRRQLFADGQVLSLDAAPTGTEVIVDNADATGVTVAGEWTASAASTGYWGADYLHDGSTNKTGKSVTFTPTLPAAGPYTVQARWTANANRSAAVSVDVVHPGGTNTIFVNQQAGGGAWVTLLTTNFLAGAEARVIVRAEGTTGYVVADAIRFVSGRPRVAVGAAAAVVAEDGTARGRFVVVREDAGVGAALTVRYAVAGTATPDADYRALPGSVTIPAGAAFAAVPVEPIADALAEGDETVTVSLDPDDAYAFDAPALATVTLRDRARDGWRHAHFSTAELADPDISGDAADPDGDGTPNFLEYALKFHPRQPDDAAVRPRGRLVEQADAVHLRMEYAKVADAMLYYGVERATSLQPSDWSEGGVSDELFLPELDRFARQVLLGPGDRQLFLRLFVRE